MTSLFALQPVRLMHSTNAYAPTRDRGRIRLASPSALSWYLNSDSFRIGEWRFRFVDGAASR